MDLSKLLKPASMAVIGATDKPGMTSGATKAALCSSISDHVYLVNPRREDVNGVKCYKGLAELPEIVDQIVLCTPAKTIAPYLEEAGKLGVRSAVVIASGFDEERTPAAQAMAREVREICLRHDIALCGPNCVGYSNLLDDIYGGAGACTRQGDIKSGIAIVAQSGYITSGFQNPDGKYIAYSVSAGNCSVCALEDYMLYFAEDDRVSCIAAYVEGFKKPDVLVKALRLAAEKRKPVVIQKAGLSDKGSFAVASHTGSLAGDFQSYVSVFEKFGVVQTYSLQDFCGTARMFAVLNGNIPKKTGVGAINFSGGENTTCADSCARMGISLPDYQPETVEAVMKVLPSYATPQNPLDATTTLFTEDEKVRALFKAVCADKSMGLIILGNDVGEVSEFKDVTCSRIMAELAGQGQLLPALVTPSFEKNRSIQIREKFEEAGIPVLSTGDLAFTAVKHLCDFAAYDYRAATLKLAIPDQWSNGRTVLSESASKEEIAACGVRVPRQALAATKEELLSRLEDIPFPVVLKVDSPDILHKTNAGGVKLGVCTAEEACTAFDEIMASCRAYMPDARITGVLLQEMVPQGVEFILGIKNDVLFGPKLLVGMGGVFVEIFKDVALYPCPLSKDEAERMLKTLKGYRMLTGYRGSKPCDIDALTDLMVRISQYAVANKNTVAEMDLNPVFVYEEGKGVCAADALIIKIK